MIKFRLIWMGVLTLVVADPSAAVSDGSDSGEQSVVMEDARVDESGMDDVERSTRQFVEFLQAHWGKGKEQVKSDETGSLAREREGQLVYAWNVAEHAALAGYQFHANKLVRGKYVLLQRPILDLNEFIDYYARIKAVLNLVYGQPQDDQAIWLNDLYRPLPEYWGVAVLIGHLTYSASWETPAGRITLGLSGDHYGKLVLDYRSKDFQSGTEEARNRTTGELRTA